MRAAIAAAEVGDEQRGLGPDDDRAPGTGRRAARPRGGAVPAQRDDVQRDRAAAPRRPGGDEVILDRTAHPINSEAGGPAQLAGAMIRDRSTGDGGIFTAGAARGRDPHAGQPLRAALAAGVGRADHQHRRRPRVAAGGDPRRPRGRPATRAARAPRRRAADERGRRLRRRRERLRRRLRHRLDRLHQGPRRAGGRRPRRLAGADRRGLALEADAGRGVAPVRDRGRRLPVRARPPRRAAGRGPRARARARRGSRRAAGRRARPSDASRPTS